MTLPPDSRTRIVEAATDLFVRNGFHGTTIRQLSDAVGVGPSTLYHYIGSKEQLLFEISMSLLESALADAQEIVRRRQDPHQAVRDLARSLLRHHAAHGDAWSVAIHEAGSLSELHQKLVVSVRDEYEQLWRKAFDRGAKAGRWRRPKPVEARGVLGMLNSVPRWMDPKGALTPEEIADCYVALVLDGLRGSERV